MYRTRSSCTFYHFIATLCTLNINRELKIYKWCWFLSMFSLLWTKHKWYKIQSFHGNEESLCFPGVWVDISEEHNATSHSTLQIKAVCSSASLVDTYHKTKCHNPENHNTTGMSLKYLACWENCFLTWLSSNEVHKAKNYSSYCSEA